MALVSLKCPECGGEVQFEETLKQGFCVYCGTKIINEKTVPSTVILDHKEEIKGKLELAKIAYLSKDYDKVSSLTDDVIALDSNCKDAWNLKASITVDNSPKSILIKKAEGASNNYEIFDSIETPDVSGLCKVIFEVKKINSHGATMNMIIDDEDKGVFDTGSIIELYLTPGKHTFHLFSHQSVSKKPGIVINAEKHYPSIEFTASEGVRYYIKDGISNVKLSKA